MYSVSTERLLKMLCLSDFYPFLGMWYVVSSSAWHVCVEKIPSVCCVEYWVLKTDHGRTVGSAGKESGTDTDTSLRCVQVLPKDQDFTLCIIQSGTPV